MEAMATEEVQHPNKGAKTIIVKTLSGQEIKLEEVDLSATIEHVKDMICKEIGWPRTIQRLVYNGESALKDWYTLKEYGFQYGTDIILVPILRGGGVPKFKIHVRKLDGNVFTLMLPSLTIPIYEIWNMIDQQERIRQTEQHLVCSGTPLDQNKTLAHYKIQENSTLDLARGPFGGNSSHHEDEDGLFNTKLQAAGTYAATVDEGSNHGHDQEVINNTAPLPDQLTKQRQIRWSKYSVKALVFAITTLVTYLGSASTLFSTGSMVFKISVGAFFITDAMLSIMMPPKIGNALVYLSRFLLVLVSYLLLVSFNKYYGYAILPLLLPIVTALLQHKLQPGLMQQQRSNNNEGDHTVDIEVSGQDHGTNEEDGQHFDSIFELSADIVNCGGIITVVFGNYMVGPVTAVGFLFFYTVVLGLYLMMVTTVRAAVLTPHARYLAKLLKVRLVITLITALIRGVHR